MSRTVILLFFLPVFSQAQPNCNAFLYSGDTLQYQACKLVEDIDKKYYQFSKEYQETMDEALGVCPWFAYAYREKAAAYVKSGDFFTWKKLIDKAVEYAPLDCLGVRASLRYKFFGDYTGAIADIDQLGSITNYDIGTTSNGTYHLNVVKALCYKLLGENDKAIEILKMQLKTDPHTGAFDYLHLGVLYLEANMYPEAITAFEEQEKINNLSENQYYMALAYKALSNANAWLYHLEEAKRLYLQGYQMHDPYNQLIDEIFLEDVETELKEAYAGH